MPGRPRVLLADYPLHIVQRGINREPCFSLMKMTTAISIGWERWLAIVVAQFMPMD
jgi:hypothetical protein